MSFVIFQFPVRLFYGIELALPTPIQLNFTFLIKGRHIDLGGNKERGFFCFDHTLKSRVTMMKVQKVALRKQLSASSWRGLPRPRRGGVRSLSIYRKIQETNSENAVVEFISATIVLCRWYFENSISGGVFSFRLWGVVFNRGGSIKK